MMIEAKLEEALMELLEEEAYKPTFRMAQELRAEYPHLWQQLQEKGKEQYGRSCSAAQLPSNAVARCLHDLEKKGLVEKQLLENGQVSWRLRRDRG